MIAKARTEADQIKNKATNEGTMLLFRATNITTQEQMTTFTYIRTLKNRDDLELEVSYLVGDNVVKVKSN